MSPPDAPLDLTLLRTFLEGDAEQERLLLCSYVKQADENMRILGDNRTSVGAKEWHETAHMLKGGASAIGADILSKLCHEAQDFRGTASEQDLLFQRIHHEYLRVREYLINAGLLS